MWIHCTHVFLKVHTYIMCIMFSCVLIYIYTSTPLVFETGGRTPCYALLRKIAYPALVSAGQLGGLAGWLGL